MPSQHHDRSSNRDNQHFEKKVPTSKHSDPAFDTADPGLDTADPGLREAKVPSTVRQGNILSEGAKVIASHERELLEISSNTMRAVTGKFQVMKSKIFNDDTTRSTLVSTGIIMGGGMAMFGLTMAMGKPLLVSTIYGLGVSASALINGLMARSLIREMRRNRN